MIPHRENRLPTLVKKREKPEPIIDLEEYMEGDWGVQEGKKKDDKKKTWKKQKGSNFNMSQRTE
jgi:hypothetical protein